MKKVMGLMSVLALGACVYGRPVNQERFYGNSDITKIDWSKVDGRGTSCQTNWLLGIFPFGDNSVASAVERAEISKVAYVDTDVSVLIPLLVERECTNVWGELTPEAKAAASYKNIDVEEEEEVETKASDYGQPAN